VLSIFAEGIRYLGGLGVTCAVIHPSWEPIADNDRADAFKRSKEGLHYLAEVGATCGLSIAAEDLPRTCLANCSAEMLALLEGSDHLRVCMDANHLLKEKTEHFIRQVGNKIITVHISDYDFVNERHWLPGKGINNWTAIIAALAESGYTGPFLYEVTQKTAGPLTAKDLVTCWEGLLGNYEASI
jgi:sugar phosphate isomerase/epimerase